MSSYPVGSNLVGILVSLTNEKKSSEFVLLYLSDKSLVLAFSFNVGWIKKGPTLHLSRKLKVL